MPPQDLTSRYPYYVLGVLFCVNVLNLTDRQVVYILFPLLKADLQFTDTQLGALGALPFALFYSFMGIPLGWLAAICLYCGSRYLVADLQARMPAAVAA